MVLLGASNLSRGFPVAVATAQHAFDGRSAFYVAKGHGRSYGKESRCFGKKIPGIFSCGIWRALQQEKSMPIVAFLTDIGNDLAYEVPVETVVEWVESCLERLLARSARVVLCDLPLERLRRLSATQYRCFRALFFPGCRLGLSEMLNRAESLSIKLRFLAQSREIPLFTGRNEWYGFDPIHVRRSYYPVMWEQLFRLVTDAGSCSSPNRCSFRGAWYLRRLRPEKWSVFSRERSVTQPAGLLRDGSTISMY